ncbi:MBL fold metallo-hydrolase [Pseudoflavonifractor phocaeensis]|uniref:MBL fold metallo-hydrolase n=1 Tax=Pseudoflavonifractor phocaeensis TaxID=1870988 RepID=UPI00195DFFFD|nr:MBL fold metallo-hydrolase [Pseudoflavonifractor phocaeensis]MBM6871346.1 MBL fold metallo-hydrolase [Pseudoflavonifractor phocaeensis]
MKIKMMQVGPIGTNCYLVENELSHTAVVVDPGGEGERILSAARTDGVTIQGILLTHAHYDHTGGVQALRAALPGLPVYLHPEDAALLGSPVFPDVGPVTPCTDGMDLQAAGLTFHVLHTPGHTPGSVTFQAEDVLLTGDTLFQGSMGRTDLPGGSYTQIMASLARLGRLPGNLHVLPGHMDLSTLDRERASNYYMKEALDG